MYQLKKTDNYMKPVIVIKKDKSEVLTNSSLLTIKGHVGSGKSRLAMNIMVGLLGGNDKLGFDYTVCPKDKYIYYVSTEMSRYHLQKRLLQIIKEVPTGNDENLLFFDALHDDDIITELKKVFRENPPFVIVFDQVGDLVSNINNIEESHVLSTRLLKLQQEFDCSIIGIIHQNEASNNLGKARGHLGSILEQKVVCSISINVNKGTFDIRATKVREGQRFIVQSVFDESTGMLRATTTPSEMIEQLTFPCNSTELKIQISKITGRGLESAEKIRQALVKKKLVIYRKEGKNNIYSKAIKF